MPGKCITCSRCNTTFNRADHRLRCPFCGEEIKDSIRKYVKFKSKIVNQDCPAEESNFDTDKELPEKVPVDKMMRHMGQVGITHPTIGEYNQAETSLPQPSGDSAEVSAMIKAKDLRVWDEKRLRYLRDSSAGEAWLREFDKSRSIKEPIPEPSGTVNYPFLSSIQNKMLYMLKIENLSYKDIAFRLSGNRKGAYSCEQVSYQIRSAKKKILQFRCY